MYVTGRRQRTHLVPVGVKTWAIYWLHGADGALLYIGITCRDPWTRISEHVDDQPWGHLIDVRRCWVSPEIYYSEDDAEAAEEAAIRRHRPRFNWKHNENNPNREWWGPPRKSALDRAREERTMARTQTPVLPRRRWRLWLLAVLWLVLYAGMTAAILTHPAPGQPRPWWATALSSAIAATAVAGWVGHKTRRRGRR